MQDKIARTVDGLARAQRGHVTSAQLREAGVSRSTVSRQEKAGRLVRVARSTYRLASVPGDLPGAVMAACLELEAVASHRTAAWLHDLIDRWYREIEVTRRKGRAGAVDQQILAGDGGRSHPLRVHFSTNLPASDILVVRGIPTTSVARTVLSLAALVPAEMTADELAQVVGRAVDRGQATDAWLWWLLTERRCRGRNGVRVMEEVLAGRAKLGPTESWLERELLAVLRRAGLPLPKTQRIIRRHGRFAARVDFVYEAEKVVIEALGYEHHRTLEEIESDTRRANELQLEGYQVLQFTTPQILRSPESVVATVLAACPHF